MTNTNEILEMLRTGKSVQEIGDNFANILNEAKAQYDQEQKNRETEKLNRLTDIIDSLIDWIDEYVAPVPGEVNGEMYAKEFIDAFNEAKGLSNIFFDNINFTAFDKYINNTKNQKKEVKAASSRQQDLDLKDIVDIFLKQENIV